MNKQVIRRVRVAFLKQCAAEGIVKQEKVAEVVAKALMGVGKASVAGVKAAMTKGQRLATA